MTVYCLTNFKDRRVGISEWGVDVDVCAIRQLSDWSNLNMARTVLRLRRPGPEVQRCVSQKE